MALESGTRLAHYEITNLIGSGGMGEVYRARDTKLGREVAIKVLHAEFARDAERLARLDREARMLAALNHPNIAAIHGLEESDGTRFLVLELVEGDTLAARLQRGAIPLEESLKLALQIAEALESAHERGVIHRDLKPANIKITPDGRLKVLDFGLARALEGDRGDVNLSNSPTLSVQATRQGVILGTASYMSPEQAKGRPVDRRADVWAFGCVLYEMLTGRQAFQGEDVSTVLARVLEREPDYAALPAGLHPRLRELLERCLEKDPASRYHDVGDLRVDLQKVRADPGGAALELAGPKAGRSPTVRWVAALALAVLAAALAWFLKPAAPVSRLVVRSVISPVGHPPAPGDAGRNIAISPDGRRVVYRAIEGALYLRNLDDLEGAAIRGPAGPIDPFFAPDGASIGFTSAATVRLGRVPVTGGPTTSLVPISSAPQGASWGPDNGIVFAIQGSGLLRVPGLGGEAELLTELGTTALGHVWPELLPGEDAVVFTIVQGIGSENHQVAVVDLDTRKQEVLVPRASHARYAASGHLVYAIDDALWAVRFDPGARTILGEPVLVLEGVAWNPNSGLSEFDISDDGSLVYITAAGVFGRGGAAGLADLNLTLFDRQGNQRTLGAPPRPYRNPRVSPDGRQIAVEIFDGTQSSVWVYEIGGGAAMRRLTQVTEGNNIRPIWTPDGQRITFASDRDGPYSIYWQPADGSGPAERLTTAEDGTVHRPESWSPDGVLSFELRRGQLADYVGHPETGEIWTLQADGAMELFYDLPGRNQFGSAFSPDGRWLAYTSAETIPADARAFRVFVGAYPENAPRYEIVGSGASWPVWSPDGAELFYRPSTIVGATALNSVAIRTGPTFSFTTEENLIARGFSIVTDYRDYDPLPDGSGFIMLTPAVDTAATAGEAVDPGPDPEVVLVQNFFEVLRRLLPAG